MRAAEHKNFPKLWMLKLDQVFTKPTVFALEPGLVLIKHAISSELQRDLVELAWSLGGHDVEGQRSGGFWETCKKSGKALLNNSPTRGRFYAPVSKYPEWVAKLCETEVSRARTADVSMPHMLPTHLVLLYYASSGGRAWHRDSQVNDGSGEEPVVSVSIGDACDFALRHDRNSDGKVLRLESGDVVLFGGPCRNMLHAVTKVHTGSWPAALAEPQHKSGRFSMTSLDCSARLYMILLITSCHVLGA